jgi:hypothetical protein
MAKIETYDVMIGSNIFQQTPCAIGMQTAANTINPLLHARIRESDHQIQFSLDVASQDGVQIKVRNNIPVGVDSEKFEIIHLPEQKLVVSRNTNQTILDIRRIGLLANGQIEIYGDFIFEGIHIESTEEYLKIGNSELSGCQCIRLGGVLLYPTGSFAFGFSGVMPPFSNS